MNKYSVMLLIVLGSVSCTAKNDSYYRDHPKELQAALKECSEHQFQGSQCSLLQKLGQRMGLLAYQLQSNPQGFGAKILSLQETLAAQEHASSAEEQERLASQKEELADRLAVVKWLESPAS